MSAQCGPINPLQKLTNHQQLDRSLHQDHQQQRNHQNNAFRQQNYNPQLELEFQQQFNPAFQNFFQGAQLNNRLNTQHSQQVGSSSDWANQFANISLNAPQQHRVQQKQTSDWSAQFANQNYTPQAQHSLHQQQQGGFYQGFNQLQPNYTRQELMPQSQYRTEHQELHHHEQFHKDLESEFSRLEEQFNQTFEPVQEKAPIPQKHENEQFKKAAATISGVMTNTNIETSEKFKNSNFLKLMQMVSNGKVTLNQEETKLVNESGNDIHEEKLAQSEAEQTGLPDPLEGLNPSDLSSPFESARRVGELHQEQYTWDDVYDDYKHDDDSF